MLPPKEVWGPALWKSLDIYAEGLGDHPDQGSQKAMYRHLKDLGYLLPCPECREHFQQYWALHAPQGVLTTKSTLEWLHKLQVHIRSTMPPHVSSFSTMTASITTSNQNQKKKKQKQKPNRSRLSIKTATKTATTLAVKPKAKLTALQKKAAFIKEHNDRVYVRPCSC